VTVPLDRAGKVAGSVTLRVQRIRARNATRPPLFVFAAEPGASTIRTHLDSGSPPTSLESWFPPDERRRDLVLIDLRGTGGSGALRCDLLQRGGTSAAAAAACAGSLGPAATHYSVGESVADLDAVRAALGAPKIALFGDGFGATVALAYARRHPDRVDRMALQSPRAAGPLDPFFSAGMRAAPAQLRKVCAGRLCARATPDPVGDFARIGERLASGPLTGTVVDAAGRRRPASVDPFGVFSTLAAGGTDPFALATLFGEVRNAGAGDPAPLLRAIDWRRSLPALGAAAPTRISAAAAVAQVCQSADLPWPAGTAAADRPARVAQLVAGLPASTFGPFGRAAALRSDLVETCGGWPAAGHLPVPDRPLPAVPTLIVAGDLSLTAPPEVAAAVAAEIPGAELMVVSDHWESPLFSDPTGCVSGVFNDFLDGGVPDEQCSRGSFLTVRSLKAPPRSLAELAPLGARGRPGRTFNAVRATLRDGLGALNRTPAILSGARVVRVGGLRRGSYRVSLIGRPRVRRLVLRVRGASFVPGVRVSGTVILARGDMSTGVRLLVRGAEAAHGWLTLRGETLRGRLGGRKVRGPLTSEYLFDSGGVSNGY